MYEVLRAQSEIILESADSPEAGSASRREKLRRVARDLIRASENAAITSNSTTLSGTCSWLSTTTSRDKILAPSSGRQMDLEVLLKKTQQRVGWMSLSVGGRSEKKLEERYPTRRKTHRMDIDTYADDQARKRTRET